MFNSEIYKMPNYIINEYFYRVLNKQSKIIELLPQNELVLNCVNSRRNETEYTANNSILGESDLGISIYNYCWICKLYFALLVYNN